MPPLQGPTVLPVYPMPALKAFAGHALRFLSSQINDLLGLEDEALIALEGELQEGADGIKHTIEHVGLIPLNQERTLCDRCTTSIPNVHASCGSCGWDLCIHCLKELGGAAGKLRCANAQCTDKPVLSVS